MYYSEYSYRRHSTKRREVKKLKKTEFMRAAAKVIIFFLTTLIKKNMSYVKISVNNTRGVYHIKFDDYYFRLCTYCTGTISWSYGRNWDGRISDYNVYYAYNSEDNFDEVLKQLKTDLKTLGKLLTKIKDEPYLYCFTRDLFTFEYGKPVSLR